MNEFNFRTIKELLVQIAMPHATASGNKYEEAKAELMAKCSNEISVAVNILNKSIQKSTESQDQLSKRIFWLNVILTIATTIGAIATVFIACQG